MTIKNYKYILERGIEGQSKIKAGLILARNEVYLNPVESEKILGKIKHSVQVYGNDEQNAEYSILLSLVCIRLGNYSAAQQKLDSLSTTIVKFTLRIQFDYYIAYSNFYHIKGDFPSAQIYAESALPIAKELEDNNKIGDSLQRIAYCKAQAGKTEEAISILREAIKVFTLSDNSKKIVNTYSIMAFCEFRLGNHSRAFESIDKALTLLRISKRRYNKGQEATLLSDKAIVYQTIGDYNNAFASAIEASHIFKKSGDKASYGTTLCHIGTLYISLEKFAEGLPYLYEAHTIAVEMNIVSLLTVAKINIAIAHMHLGDSKTAKEYLTIAKRLAEKYNSFGNICFCMIHFGEYYELLNLNKKAYTVLYEALELAERHNDTLMIGLSRTALARHSEKNNEWENAFAQFIMAHETLPIMNKADNAFALAGISRTALKLGQKGTALEVALRAAEYIKTVHAVKVNIEVQQALAEAYEANGDIENAMRIYKSINVLQKKSESSQTVAAIMSAASKIDIKGTKNLIADLETEVKMLRMENEGLRNSLRGQTLKTVQHQEVISTVQKIIADDKQREHSKKLEKITHLIHSTDTAESVWYVLEREVERTDPGFSKLLLKKHPLLSKSELKVCLLLSMKISSKNIASVLFVEKITIDKHRQNIRKKMGIKSNEDIVMYLEKLRLSLK